jgi:hypothetical protein
VPPFGAVPCWTWMRTRFWRAMKARPIMDEANDNDLGWHLSFKEDGVWLDFRVHHMLNLGPEQAVMSYLADVLAQRDFGE